MRIVLLFVLLLAETLGQRICETQGTCRNCGENRFSYYRCGTTNDCFTAEACVDGFCCPLASQPQLPPFAAQSQSGHIECPDGSSWLRLCNADADCIFTDEVCAEGKCCSSCQQRRHQILDELPTNEVVGVYIPQCTDDGLKYRPRQCRTGTEDCWCVNAFGQRLENTGSVCEHEIRRKQESLIVSAQELRKELENDQTTKESRRTCDVQRAGLCLGLPPGSPAQSSDKDECQCDDDCYGRQKCCRSLQGIRHCSDPLPIYPVMIASSPTGSLCAEGEAYSPCYSECQASCTNPDTPPCPSPFCRPGCHCLPGFIRRDTNPLSPCIPQAACTLEQADLGANGVIGLNPAVQGGGQCEDPLRAYADCGSSCPMACETRTLPRCKETRCVKGCFCRVPYVLEKSNDPLNARCVLPSECPPIVEGSFSNPQRTPTISPYGPFSPTHPTLLPPAQQCADPLKNYLTCGSLCPSSCTNLQPEGCSTQCVSGCFCRSPFILQDERNSNSGESKITKERCAGCVLPHQCGLFPSTSSGTEGSSTASPSPVCVDPRKEWSQCGALYCARSCANLSGQCSEGVCASGCVCREPYVLSDPTDPASRCVLPSECASHCDDALKEFKPCGSSCPVGCDNPHPDSCTPCISGCFCKNGFVFENSKDWRNSLCIRLEDCPKESTDSNGTTSAEFNSVFESGETTNINSTVFNSCPAFTKDIGGRGCQFDTDCPNEQKCCRTAVTPFGETPQRCTCPDPNSAWDSCGSLCPEYCGQKARPVCSNTCNPGCHCAPGYVKARNDVAAPCVPIESCDTESTTAASHNDSDTSAVIDSSEKPSEKSSEQEDESTTPIDASAYFYSTNGVRGRLNFLQAKDDQLNVKGTIYGLPSAVYSLVVHQFGDVSDDCAHLGPPLGFPSNPFASALLGELVVADAANTTESTFKEMTSWPISVLAGRSVAVHKNPWSPSSSTPPVSCATIGVTRV